MFGGKIGTEGSVLQKLCHFVIPPDFNGYKLDKYRCDAQVPNKPYANAKRPYHKQRSLSIFPVENFKHAQNLTPDRMDITGHHRTRSVFIG